MFPVFCSRALSVARKTGPSSATDSSSPGRGHDTSTLTGSLATVEGGADAVLTVSAIRVRGELGSSVSTALALESTDCDDATRIFGGALRRKGGVGELGWLRKGVGSGQRQKAQGRSRHEMGRAARTGNPEREAGKGVEPVCSLVVLDKLV